MKRLALPLALFFVLIGAVRIVSTYREVSITTDEPYHFSCGLDYLALHRLCVGENPLLEPIAAAALPFLAGVRPDMSIETRQRELTYRDRSRIAVEQLQRMLLTSPDPRRVIVLMRAGVLPFFIAAALAVFFGARRLFGETAAVLSTALFTLVPSVLAHAGLATTDISATATVTSAFFVLVWWSEAPSWKRSVCLGIAAGLVAFSKFSGAVFLVAAAAVAVLFHLLLMRPGLPQLARLGRERAPGVALAAAVASFVLWAGYLFTVGPAPGLPPSWKVPAPRVFASFQELLDHSRAGHWSYLLGQTSITGRWLFFPVALAVKTPLPLLLLLPAGLLACWERRRRSGLLPVAFVLGILATALPSRINLGSRHILPIFAGLSIVAALGLLRVMQWLRGGLIAATVAAVLIGWTAIAGARAHPDYLAWFNEFASRHPDAFLLDSDLDWDQDWALAGRFLREQRATQVTIDLGRLGPFHSPEILQHVDGLPPVRETTWEESGQRPDPGWHIVSATKLRNALAASQAALPWYVRLRAVDRIGGLYVFHVPPDFR